MSVRAATVAVKVGGVPVVVDDVSWEHRAALSGGDSGSEATLDWSAAPATTIEGAPVEVTWTDDDGPVTCFSGRVSSTSGVSDLDPGSTLCTDWYNRLNQRVDVRPVASTMPPNPDLDGGLRRRPGLLGTWVTQQVLARAGFNTGVRIDRRAVYYVSHAGSAWPVADPAHAWAPLGTISQVARLGNDTTWPGTMHGDDQPCMDLVYSLGVCTPLRHGTPTGWQLVWDMGTRTPPTGHLGKIRVRPHPSPLGAGFEVEWTQTVLTLRRVDVDGTTTALGQYPRATDGVYSMRWSVVVDGTGLITVLADVPASATHPDGRRAWDLTGTGISLPATGSGLCSVRIHSTGMIGAVSLLRASDAGLVTTPVTARIRRTGFDARILPGLDWIPPTRAGDILADQADAERGLRGMPILQWLDHETGVMHNVDFAVLAAGSPVLTATNRPGPGQTPRDLSTWGTPAREGPYCRVVIHQRRPTLHFRPKPSIEAAVGSQETVEPGEPLGQYLHPPTGTTWLEVDLRPRLAGRPHPAPHHKWLDRGIGSWVGGHKYLDDEVDTQLGWVEASEINGWSLDGDRVVGALTMLDPRTILLSGTVNLAPGRLYSSTPYPNSVLPDHRKNQPLPQVRATGVMYWAEQDSVYDISADDTLPELRHDVGMWVQTNTWAQQVAAELAAQVQEPLQVQTVVTAINPRIKVGMKIRSQTVTPEGTSHVDGIVVGARVASLASDEMTLTLVVTSRQDSTGAPRDVAAPGPLPEPTPPLYTAPPSITDPSNLTQIEGSSS